MSINIDKNIWDHFLIC